MSKKRRGTRQDAQSLVDRCALAFVSGLSAFISGALLWMVVSYLLSLRGGVGIPAVSFHIVWLFTAVMALLGFFRMENHGLTLLTQVGKVLHFLWRIIMLPHRMRW